MSKEHTAVGGALDAAEVEATPVAEIAGIVAELRAGFASGVQRGIDSRKAQLRALLRGLREEKQALLDAVYHDLHKPQAETDMYEFGAAEYEIGQMLDKMEAWTGAQRVRAELAQPVFLLSRAEVRREALGTVLVVGAWNFPLRLPLLPLIGALAAGNCAVLKPSELSPLSATALARAVTKYTDPRVVRVVQGGPEQGAELLSQHFDHYFYTGGGSVGRLVAHAAADHLAGVTLELGGKSPAIVHADVDDLVPAATRIMWSRMSNAGQTCVAADYLLVHRSVKDRLVPLLIQAVVGVYGASPLQSPDYGRCVNTRHWRRLKAMLDETSGTRIDITKDKPDEAARYMPPVLVDNVGPDDALMRDEIFGPILPIVAYDTLDEAIALVNANPQPLAMYVFAGKDAAEYVLSRTRSGGAVVNDTMLHLASHSTPFGGVGPSGVGNYTGRYSIETFTHQRYVLHRPLWFPPPGLDTIRAAPYGGPENAWKAGLGYKMVYPRPWSLRDSVASKLAALVPLWRILAIIPGVLVALLTTKPIIGRVRSAAPTSE